MGNYDVMQVCLNGHQITENYLKSPQFRKAFCTTCGQSTIHQCPSCGSDIKGAYHYERVISLGPSAPVPDICEYCGEDFPWREKKNRLVKELKENKGDNLFILDQIFDKFHLVVKQLRQRYNDRETLDVGDEYDVQDLLHSLLVIFYDDIRPEEWTPSYAGASSRTDFLLKDENMVIEVKKTRKTLKARQLGEELIIDIARYKKHPDCKLLYCFVYDPDGFIVNPKGLENDLNSDDQEMKVRVKIIPKGH
ncbi:MAG: DUF2321 domain-containing protein [Sphingobacterium sp.]|jgi:hypothetical protein|nr:DUF2321 domain-containing protein [Sphingobacterium sp.]